MIFFYFPGTFNFSFFKMSTNILRRLVSIPRNSIHLGKPRYISNVTENTPTNTTFTNTYISNKLESIKKLIENNKKYYQESEYKFLEKIENVDKQLTWIHISLALILINVVIR